MLLNVDWRVSFVHLALQGEKALYARRRDLCERDF